MIDLREIRETIDEIKRNGTTISQAEKLALLYIAAEYMEREENYRMPAEAAQNYALAAAPMPDKEMDKHIKTRGTSPFLAACDGLETEKVLMLLNEHMDVIRVLYPKEYDAILRRLDRMRE